MPNQDRHHQVLQRRVPRPDEGAHNQDEESADGSGLAHASPLAVELRRVADPRRVGLQARDKEFYKADAADRLAEHKQALECDYVPELAWPEQLAHYEHGRRAGDARSWTNHGREELAVHDTENERALRLKRALVQDF